MTCDQFYDSGNVDSAAQVVRGRATSLQPEYRSDAASLGGSPCRSRENHSTCGGKCGGKIRPKWKRTYGFHRKSLIFLVGARGFEPPTTCTPCRYATRLRYAPKEEKYNRHFSDLESGRMHFVNVLVKFFGVPVPIRVKPRMLARSALPLHGVRIAFTACAQRR